MEPEKKDGTLNLKRLAQMFILPVFLLFLYWVYTEFRSDPSRAMGTAFVLLVFAAIIALIYYIIMGMIIFTTDVVVVEAKAQWKWLHSTDKEDKENGKDKKKKKK